MELKSEYMLLSAPYRFELHHLTPLAPSVIARDLLSVAAPQRASEGGDPAVRDLIERAMDRLAAESKRPGAADDKHAAAGGASALRLIADVYGRLPDGARISNDLSFAAKETYLPRPDDGAGKADVGEAAQAFDAPLPPDSLPDPARAPDSARALDSMRAADALRALAPSLGPFEELGAENEIVEEGLAAQGTALRPANLTIDPANLAIDPSSRAASATQWRVPAWLMAVADNRGPLGLSDAFVVFLLSAAYSSRLIDDKAAAEAIKHYGEKIAALYTGWEQFLASCALGAILAGEPSNGGSNDGSLLSAVYGFAVSPAPVFEAAGFWPRPNLSWLAENLAPLLPAQTLAEYKAYVNAVNPPTPRVPHAPGPQRFATRLLFEEAKQVLDRSSASQAEYRRCCEAADGIWAETARRHGVDFILLNPADSAAVHLPDLSHTRSSDPAHSNRFWPAFSAVKGEVEGVPFAWMDCPDSAGFLMTSSCVYRVARKTEAATPTTAQIPWDQTEFRCTATDSNGIAISIGGEATRELNVDYEALGLPGAYRDKDPEIVDAVLNPHIERLDSFFADLPWRVMDWQWREE